MVEEKLIANSEEDTALIAKEFSSGLNGDEIIAVNGELGAGKTFLIKHLLKSFQINNVSSPTFSIVNEYYGSVKVNHFDFYRINRIEELYDIGFDEYINNSGITIIEWAELYKEILPKNYIEIDIKVNTDFSRDIKIKRI